MIGLFGGPYFTVQPAKLKILFWLASVPWGRFETHWQEKYANEEKEKNSEADVPDFWVGFSESLDEDKWRMEKDERDEDNSSREPDDFLAAERSSNTMKKAKYEWKNLFYLCETAVPFVYCVTCYWTQTRIADGKKRTSPLFHWAAQTTHNPFLCLNREPVSLESVCGSHYLGKPKSEDLWQLLKNENPLSRMKITGQSSKKWNDADCRLWHKLFMVSLFFCIVKN